MLCDVQQRLAKQVPATQHELITATTLSCTGERSSEVFVRFFLLLLFFGGPLVHVRGYPRKDVVGPSFFSCWARQIVGMVGGISFDCGGYGSIPPSEASNNVLGTWPVCSSVQFIRHPVVREYHRDLVERV